MDPLLPQAVAVIVISFAIAAVRRSLRYRWQTRFAFRDYLWEQLSADELDRRTHEHFDEQTVALARRGFRALGDFRLAETPRRQIIRVLVGPDPRVFAHAGFCGGTFDLSFQSVFASGIGFETSSYSLGRITPPDIDLDRLLFLSANGDASEVLGAHLATLDEYAAAGDPAIEFAPADFRKPANYLHRLAHYSLLRQGKVPPAPVGDSSLVAAV